MPTWIPYLAFAGGAVIGLVAGAFFYPGFPAELPGSGSPAPATAAPAPTPASSGTVSVVDQPAGEYVIVESVTVPPPGVWVAVREVQATGGTYALGYILGAARVGGPRSAVSVPLLRPTLPDVRYAVQLYRDDAGGAFDPPRNSVFVDPDTGDPAVSYFKTTP